LSPHGTRSRYGAGCRCIPCTDANTAYQHDRKASPRRRLVYVGAARAHLRGLRDQGISVEAIARLTGCDEVNLRRILNGQRERIQRRVEERILASWPDGSPQLPRPRPTAVSVPAGAKPELSIFDELLILAGAEPSWRADAACRAPDVDPAWFFPGVGASIAPATRVCAGCSVRVECLEAGRHEPVGIWGGLSERQRRRLNARPARQAG